MGDSTGIACTIYGKVGGTNSKRKNCARCKSSYHTSCAKIISVLDKRGKSVQVCNPCLVEANAPRKRSNSVGTAATLMEVLLEPSTNSGTISRSNDEDRFNNDMKAILDRLPRLDDDFVSRSKASERRTEERTAAMESKFDEELSVLDQFPPLFERVSVNEMMIAGIAEEQNSPRCLVEESRSAMSFGMADAKLQKPETANESLSQKSSRSSS